ncbi:MAG: enoyl-CoA hydratase-related protein [Alphaproteobacteria bacterium]|jgi:enoyl-CoA hydratase/carnithine racemase|nr:enoyl-CoA hydratase-related protein [Alphaproteobacteria bacterium]MDP6567975.1 enoyl-CoA hydratase-related protein [Alphaproteobacteria bacterium]MDP6815440.1 enoyl-CoA hydratase-related protein [Alphaproteobacteria bacterium]
MDYQEVIYRAADGIATVTLNRPDRLNAMTLRMAGEIRAAMQQATDDPDVRVVVLTGAGRGFCAGADAARLQNRAGGDGPAEEPPLPFTGAVDGGIDLPEGFAAKYACIATVPKPVIAAINGPAVGVGMVLPMFADIRFAADSARLATAFAKRGLVPEYGLAWLLPRLIAPSKAFDLLYSCRLVDAPEALEMGLVDRVYPDGELMPAVLEYARELATAVSPRSNRVVKQLVYQGLDQGIDQAMEHCLAEMAEAQKSDDFREGIAAWRDKRAPAFTGR